MDPFFALSATYPNIEPVFSRTLGTLGPMGEATAAFALPGGLLPIGLRLDFAYLRMGTAPLAFKGASNSVPLTVQ